MANKRSSEKGSRSERTASPPPPIPRRSRPQSVSEPRAATRSRPSSDADSSQRREESANPNEQVVVHLSAFHDSAEEEEQGKRTVDPTSKPRERRKSVTFREPVNEPQASRSGSRPRLSSPPPGAITTASGGVTYGFRRHTNWDCSGICKLIINNAVTAENAKSWGILDWKPIDESNLRVIIVPNEIVSVANSDRKYLAMVVQDTKLIDVESADDEVVAKKPDAPRPFTKIIEGLGAPTFGEALESLLFGSVVRAGAYAAETLLDPSNM